MSGGSKIPKGWVETTLGEIAIINPRESITKGAFAKSIPMASLDPFTKKIQSFEIKEFKGGTKFRNGDTLLARITPCLENGKTAFVDILKENEVGFGSTEYIVIREREYCSDKHFLFYLSISPLFRDVAIKVMTGTSGRQRVQTDVLLNRKFNLPTLPEQQAIAAILTTFDDKIELLQAQNQTLEATAQTIFKEWFGKYQIGDELPEGWRVGKLGEVIEYINGYGFKSKELLSEPEPNSLKVFKMGDIKKGGGFNPNKTKSYFKRDDAKNLSKFILKNGDILMSMTDMKDAISLLGHTALMIYDNEYIVNQRVGLIRAKNDIDIDYPFLYLLTNDEAFIANLRGRANSGVQVNLTTQAIKESLFIIPNKETNTNFDRLVKPFFEKIKYNTNQIQTLQQTRDTLLPKLMSGKLRVEEFKD